MHEILGKFGKGKEKLNLILSNKRTYYIKNVLGYQPNETFINSCHDRKKSNPYVFKCKYYNKLSHLEAFHYSKLHDLRWKKLNLSRPIKTTSIQ